MSSISWPRTGNNSQYLILDIPNLPENVLDKSLTFFCGTCHYRETQHRNKFLKFPGMSPMVVQHPNDTIQLESLFINPYPEGANDSRDRDLCRFQSNPDAKDLLCSNNAISNIIGIVSSVLINLIDKPHILLQKIPVLISRPCGQEEQGLHVDDDCTDNVISQEGELLSIIVALMHETKVDIATVNKKTKNFVDPKRGHDRNV